MSKENTTSLGVFLTKRSINRAEVSRKTGISTSRLNQLSNNPNTHIKGSELYLISKAIKVDINIIADELFKNLKLKSEE